MGRKKKKPFIDRKNASRYTLMHRSQRDVGGDILDDGVPVGSTGMILWPDPHNHPDTDAKVLVAGNAEEQDKMKEWRHKLAAVGLLEENNSEQYLKPITGAGTFLSARGGGTIIISNPLNDPRSQPIVMKEEEELALVAEVNTQQFEGIPLAADFCIDEDIEAALMGDNLEDFEEIADDFVLDAAREPEQGDEEAFDFDAHIAKLMQDARRQATDEVVHAVEGHPMSQDQDFFAARKAIQEEEEDDSLFGGGTTLDVVPGVVPSLNPDEERALCEQFEKTLAEYDSDDMGEIYQEDIHGDRPLEGDAQVDAALDEYLQEDDIFMQSAKPAPTGGSGFSALVGTRMIPVQQLLDNNTAPEAVPDEPARPIQDMLRDAKKKIQAPELEPPPEEIFIDGKSYYSMKERNPWDCESILSTYSNLDNNPMVIGVSSRRSKKKNKNKIILSSKTGLPVLDDTNNHNNPVEDDDEEDDDDVDETFISVNRGVARSKKETKEEKAARKAQVKKERQMARIQKKATKEVFKEEFLNQTGAGMSDDVAGRAVFRYS
ncbi:LTV1 homolog (Saccharomyces cerevisiae) [Seminavis robusta]|uniref:LTV1 homolog (Saccharomyces cerevisiae) n=1 Tax=Seminavis robusta TaxID=568900 RepID=A0A9N8DFT2_9STRA|nr:LTV1 homolog (Saccharomyces cerevisiae) [Seminavis robusta]|eukprot:Sro68_g037920.1 LTV1 homolog (Saccharomyces cerevisiae) (546) ;mRNA; r:15896-17533